MTVPALLAEARRLLPIDPARAAQCAARALALAPDAVEARFTRAAALRRVGDPAGAAILLDALLAARHETWGVWFEQGMARAALGDIAPAVEALHHAVRLNPGATLAWHALGDQLTMLGQADAAAAAYARQPRSWLDNRAFVTAALALLDGAAQPAIDLNDVATLNIVAEAGLAAGRPDAVAALLARALGIAPGDAPTRYRLAIALHRAERDAEALQALVPLVAALPGVAATLALRAAVLMRLGREAAAADDYRQAVEARPADAALWHGYGHALRAIGRQGEAIAAYRRAIAIRPAFGEAYWSLANLKTWRFDDADPPAMRAALQDPALDPVARSYLHFALGKAQDDADRPERAFDHYRTANALRRQTTPYDAAAHEAFVARSVATFTRDMAAPHREALRGARPIFVLGMPRSGSTLVEQILAGHSQVEGASELPDVTAIARRIALEGSYPEILAERPPEAFARLGQDYLDRTAARRPLGRPVFVDKFPGNAFYVGLIHLMLPDARIIDVRRDALDCCVSLFTQSFADGQAYSYDLTDLGRRYRSYVMLMQHFDAIWPGRILRVRYEDLVDRFEPEVRRLLDHCGLAFEADVLRFFESGRAVRTPSSEQVRRPVFRDGIGRWRRFAPWLAPLADALGDELVNPSFRM